jgi:hypothetical protein
MPPSRLGPLPVAPVRGVQSVRPSKRLAQFTTRLSFMICVDTAAAMARERRVLVFMRLVR